MRFLKRILLAIVITILLFIAIDRVIVRSTQSRIHSDISSLPGAEVILVPGARVYAGEVSGILAQRLDAAIVVLEARKAKRILVSGDYSSRYYDEATAMKKYLLRSGVGTGEIMLDHAGFSTYDSLYRAKNIFNLRTVIIVSQDFHLPRALFIARGIGLDAIGFAASGAPLSPEQLFRSEWREPLARMKAVLDVLRHAPPAFTGSGLPFDARGTLLRW